MKLLIEAILRDNSDKLVCLITGRYQPARDFLSIYAASLNCNLVAIQPKSYEWYPLPNGVKNQSSAVRGIKENLPKLHKVIKRVISELKIDKNKTSLVGFSAVGVMALELIAHNKNPFHSIVIHAGAILRTERFPVSKNNTPILLLHNQDDDCFEWEERFLPMCECLKNKGYKFIANTKHEGKHSITEQDIETAINFINNDTFPF